MASPTRRTGVEQAQGDSEGQGSLVRCRPWGHTESVTTEQQRSNHSNMVEGAAARLTPRGHPRPQRRVLLVSVFVVLPRCMARGILVP